MNTTSRTTHAVHPRLTRGAAVLSAAEVVDTTPVADRVRALRDAHQAYAEAEGKVAEAEARLAAEKLTLVRVGASHDAAVEALACALASDGEPRVNPFAVFGAEAPGYIMRMAPADAAHAVRTLLAGLASHDDLPAATLQAGARVEQATQQVEAALRDFQARHDELYAAREASGAIARRYRKTLSALRYACRAVAVSGSPELYDTLFPPPVRARPVKGTTAAATAGNGTAAATTPPQPPTP